MFPLKDNIPTDRFPVVTVALIVANVLAYFFWQKGGLSLGDPSSPHYLQNLVDNAAFPYEITHPGEECDAQGCGGDRGDLPPYWLNAFTSMFMHGGLLHLGGNMLFLWIFGNNVEDAMGPVKFVVFYVLGGLAALALQVAIDPSSQVPTVGASGAIAAVLGGYILLYPRARVLTAIFLIIFFTLIEVPALVVLGFWFLQQILFGIYDLGSAGEGGGVAYFAHIGGFVFGLVAIKLFARRRKRLIPGF